MSPQTIEKIKRCAGLGGLFLILSLGGVKHCYEPFQGQRNWLKVERETYDSMYSADKNRDGTISNNERELNDTIYTKCKTSFYGYTASCRGYKSMTKTLDEVIKCAKEEYQSLELEDTFLI